jgi:PAS domain S-box-containing protein
LALGVSVVFLGIYVYLDMTSHSILLQNNKLSELFKYTEVMSSKSREVLASIDQYTAEPELHPIATLKWVLAQALTELDKTLRTIRRIAHDGQGTAASLNQLTGALTQISNYYSTLQTRLLPTLNPSQLVALREVHREASLYLSEVNILHSQLKQTHQSNLQWVNVLRIFLHGVLPAVFLIFLLILYLLHYRVTRQLAFSSEEKQDLLSSITLLSDDMLIEINGKSHIEMVSRSTRKILGYHQGELVGQPVGRIISGMAKEHGLGSPLLRHILDEDIVRNIPVEFRTKAGELLPVHLSGMKLIDPRSGSHKIILVARDRPVLRERFELEKQINRIKSDFVSIISHELRSPLAVVKAALDILNTKHFAKDRQGQVLDRAYNGLSRLIKVVTDLTDLAKIEAKMFPLTTESASLRTIIHNVINTLYPEAKTKKLNLESKLPSTLPNLNIDRERTTQIMVKLVENAIKYTPPGGNILITSEILNNDFVRTVISDTGCGIPHEKLHRIFNKFEQVENPLTRDADGTGLGLPIAKELVALQGGEMWVESKIGLGTKVYFTLPIAFDPEAAVVIQEAS